MRKQASEDSESTGGLGGTQPRSEIGASGRPSASPGRGWAAPSQGLGLAERVSSANLRRPRPVRLRGPRQRHLPLAG